MTNCDLVMILNRGKEDTLNSIEIGVKHQVGRFSFAVQKVDALRYICHSAV